MSRLSVVGLISVVLAGPAMAHPVPKDNHDRMYVVRLTPAGVRIAVRFEVDELRAALDLADGKITNRDRIPPLYVEYLAARLPDLLLGDVNDTALVFRVTSQAIHVSDHLRCDFLLEAPWPTAPDARLLAKQHRFVLLDVGWEHDSTSRLAFALDAAPGIGIVKAEIPDPALRRRMLRADFEPRQREPIGSYRPSLPPVFEPAKPGLGPGAALIRPDPPEFPVGEARREPGWAAAKYEDDRPPTLPVVPEALPRAKKPTLHSLLLDSNSGFGVLLLLAALFGAAHALTPGHGKTMVAAYLIGERGTIGHAVLLGIVTTLTHTAAVLILAALLPFLVGKEAHIQTALEFLGGLLIAILGAFLLVRRLTGRSDHVHLFGGHLPASGEAGPTVRWTDLILLGVAGGIVPCWDAIAMLALSIASGRLWLGLPLLLAFSAGLAFVLVAIGIGVVTTKRVARPHLEKNRDILERIGRLLPLLTAVLITIIGLWLCYDALHGNHDSDG